MRSEKRATIDGERRVRWSVLTTPSTIEATHSSPPVARSGSHTDARPDPVIRVAPATTRDRTSESSVSRRQLARELEQRLRALGLATLALVETRVDERDGGVAGEHLEQPLVVGVELVETELRDDDDPDDLVAVDEGDCDERLLDALGSLDLPADAAVRGVAGAERLSRLRDAGR